MKVATNFAESVLDIGVSGYAEAVLLRAQIRARPELKQRLVENIRKELAQHGLDISEQMAKRMVFADASEVDIGGAHVVV